MRDPKRGRRQRASVAGDRSLEHSVCVSNYSLGVVQGCEVLALQYRPTRVALHHGSCCKAPASRKAAVANQGAKLLILLPNGDSNCVLESDTRRPLIGLNFP